MAHRGFGHAYQSSSSSDDDGESASTSLQRDTNRQLTAGDTGSKFAALKKDFLFHEKRMQLLLSSSVIEGLNAAITEKLTTRDECADDCKKTLRQLSDISQMPTLTGRWNESVVASVLQLNIPLRDVVGSQLFESTSSGEVEDLKDIIKQLAEQAEEHAEFQQKKQRGDEIAKNRRDEFDDDDDLVKDDDGDSNKKKVPPSELLPSLLLSIEPSSLSSRDVRRMKDAVFSKLQVISELSHLSDALQKSGFQLAQVRSEVCRIQEQEDSANNDGEVAVSESLVDQKIQNLEKIIDIIFFRLHTVDATIDTNVTKRHSNLQALQHTTVALEGIKREKEDVINNCAEDIRRIDRSLQLQQVKEQTDSHGAELLSESRQKLSSIEEKRIALSERLKSLGSEFLETERALAKLGVERAMVIDRHLELVEQSRHAASDFAEMSRFASAHRKNLEITREKASEGFEAVAMLERLLLQETDYMKYNFRASAQRLQNVRENVAGELKSALRDYELAIGEMLRRKQEIVLKLEEEIHVAECEAELRKDIFDPLAKKFVEKQRKLEEKRNVLLNEMCVLSEKLGQQVSSIKNRLGEEFVNDRVGFDGNVNNMSATGGRSDNNNKTLGASSSNNNKTNEAKKMVSNLREKVAREMSMLQLEQAREDEISRVSLDTTQRHLRDVVDGVQRISEDDELHRRNLRKHERLLDQRQELLESKNMQISEIEERKELAALAQTVESSYGRYHQHIVDEVRRREEDQEGKRRRGVVTGDMDQKTGESPEKDDGFGVRLGGSRRNTASATASAETPKPFRQSNESTATTTNRPSSSSVGNVSNARALSIREEIRRLKAQASSLGNASKTSPSSRNNNNNNSPPHHHQPGDNLRSPLLPQHSSSEMNHSHSININNSSQLHGYQMSQQSSTTNNREELEQVLVSNTSTAVQGSGIRAAKSRTHPRVIGRD